MNSAQILTWCDEIIQRAQAIQQEVGGEPEPPEPPTDETVVAAGDDLQAALDTGGALQLEAGATFSQASSFLVRQSGTTVSGDAATRVESTHEHAFDIPIDVDNLEFRDLTVAGKAPEAVQIGVNGTSQDTIDKAPAGVRFVRVFSSGHRGKRVFDVNARYVEFHDCEVRDCYSPDGLDNQAICLLNAPGPLLIAGGYFEAASENVMIGGDKMKIPNCRPTGITILDATFSKPLAWKTAGFPTVKNLLELKDGHDVLIQRCTLTNCWKSAQDGYCFTFTPRQGGSLQRVVVEECQASNVSAIANIMGVDDNYATLPRTQVTFLGGTYVTNYRDNGGRGWFALVTNGPEWVVLDGVTATIDGSTFIGIEDKDHVDRLHILNSTWNYGSYGIRIGGYSHGEDYYGVVGEIRIEGNTIRGAHSSFRNRYPKNTYVENMAHQRELEVDSPKAIAAEEREIRDALKRMKAW